MIVHNVHERVIPVAPANAGVLLDGLASDRDALWPRAFWPVMRFDRPLGVGASGGHGPIRYLVEDYKPRQSVSFKFTGPRGFDGCHRFEVVPEGESQCVLRHTLEMRIHGLALVTWPLVFRWLHDALLEDALAQAQVVLGLQPQVSSWSPWVKALRWMLSGGKAPRQGKPTLP